MIRAALQQISIWAVPVLLVGITLAGMLRKVKVYDVFIEGAKEGFEVGVKIIPFLVGILVAIGMFRASGAMELLLAGLRPLAAATGFPASSSTGPESIEISDASKRSPSSSRIARPRR